MEGTPGATSARRPARPLPLHGIRMQGVGERAGVVECTHIHDLPLSNITCLRLPAKTQPPPRKGTHAAGDATGMGIANMGQCPLLQALCPRRPALPMGGPCVQAGALPAQTRSFP